MDQQMMNIRRLDATVAAVTILEEKMSVVVNMLTEYATEGKHCEDLIAIIKEMHEWANECKEFVFELRQESLDEMKK